MKNLHEKNDAQSWEIVRLSKGDGRTKVRVDQATIVVAVEGEAIVSVDRYESRKFFAGEMILVPPAATLTVDATTDVRLIHCYFDKEIFLCEKCSVDDLNTLCEQMEYDFNKLSFNSLINSHLALLETYVEMGINSHSLFEMKKNEFFYLLFSLYSAEDLAAFFHPILGRDISFKQFVMTHWMDARNVQELAAMAQYSTSGFFKKFVRYFNQSPYQWMLQQKADRIIMEITSGIIPLKEIARKYRFSSYQHFADFCKAQYGIPPTEIQAARKPAA